MNLFALLAIIGLLYWIYKWATAHNDEFIQRGLPFEKPVPLFGNNIDLILNKKSFQLLMAEFYARTRRQ